MTVAGAGLSEATKGFRPPSVSPKVTGDTPSGGKAGGGTGATEVAETNVTKGGTSEVAAKPAETGAAAEMGKGSSGGPKETAVAEANPDVGSAGQGNAAGESGGSKAATQVEGETAAAANETAGGEGSAAALEKTDPGKPDAIVKAEAESAGTGTKDPVGGEVSAALEKTDPGKPNSVLEAEAAAAGAGWTPEQLRAQQEAVARARQLGVPEAEAYANTTVSIGKNLDPQATDMGVAFRNGIPPERAMQAAGLSPAEARAALDRYLRVAEGAGDDVKRAAAIDSFFKGEVGKATIEDPQGIKAAHDAEREARGVAEAREEAAAANQEVRAEDESLHGRIDQIEAEARAAQASADNSGSAGAKGTTNEAAAVREEQVSAGTDTQTLPGVESAEGQGAGGASDPARLQRSEADTVKTAAANESSAAATEQSGGSSTGEVREAGGGSEGTGSRTSEAGSAEAAASGQEMAATGPTTEPVQGEAPTRPNPDLPPEAEFQSPEAAERFSDPDGLLAGERERMAEIDRRIRDLENEFVLGDEAELNQAIEIEALQRERTGLQAGGEEFQNRLDLRQRQAAAGEFAVPADSPVANRPQGNINGGTTPRRQMVQGDSDYLAAIMGTSRFEPTQNHVYADTINARVNEILTTGRLPASQRGQIRLVELSDGSYVIRDGHHSLIAAEIAARLTNRPLLPSDAARTGGQPIIPPERLFIETSSTGRDVRGWNQVGVVESPPAATEPN
jgi:hypothetical protein